MDKIISSNRFKSSQQSSFKSVGVKFLVKIIFILMVSNSCIGSLSQLDYLLSKDIGDLGDRVGLVLIAQNGTILYKQYLSQVVDPTPLVIIDSQNTSSTASSTINNNNTNSINNSTTNNTNIASSNTNSTSPTTVSSSLNLTSVPLSSNSSSLLPNASSTSSNSSLISNNSSVVNQTINLTKPFTQASIIYAKNNSIWMTVATALMLVDSQKISITDTIDQYFPEYFKGEDFQAVTIKSLMTHTSGLQEINDWIIDPNPSLDQVLSGIAKGGKLSNFQTERAKFNFKPGEYFQVSYVGAQILGAIVANVTKKNWTQYFSREFAYKIKLNNTGYFGYGGVNKTRNICFGSGMNTTIMDYAYFLLMLINKGQIFNNTILQESTVNLMLSANTGNIPIYKVNATSMNDTVTLGLGCQIINQTCISQNNAGFTGWIDKKRGYVGVFLVDYSSELTWPIFNTTKQFIEDTLDGLPTTLDFAKISFELKFFQFINLISLLFYHF